MLASCAVKSIMYHVLLSSVGVRKTGIAAQVLSVSVATSASRLTSKIINGVCVIMCLRLQFDL
eukprot:3782763-Amphidinium_carterae.2